MVIHIGLFTNYNLCGVHKHKLRNQGMIALVKARTSRWTVLTIIGEGRAGKYMRVLHTERYFLDLLNHLRAFSLLSYQSFVRFALSCASANTGIKLSE